MLGDIGLAAAAAAAFVSMLMCAGVAHRYYGTAVGKGRQSVKTEIERLKFDQLTCRQAVVECAKV